MPDILVRGVPQQMHEELKDRAEAAGVSLQGYVLQLLKLHVSRPSMATWLERLDRLPRVDAITGGAQALEAARDELP